VLSVAELRTNVGNSASRPQWSTLHSPAPCPGSAIRDRPTSARLHFSTPMNRTQRRRSSRAGMSVSTTEPVEGTPTLSGTWRFVSFVATGASLHRSSFNVTPNWVRLPPVAASVLHTRPQRASPRGEATCKIQYSLRCGMVTWKYFGGKVERAETQVMGPA